MGPDSLSGGAQQQEKGQRAETETQKVSSEHDKNFLYFEGDRTLEPASHWGSGVPFPVDNIILCNLL